MNKLGKNATKLVEILNKAGFTAFFAGGYVRDKIMKRSANDIDIATNATPKEIKKVLDKNKIKHIEIGEQFGVIAAVYAPRLSSGQKSEKSQIFEIATFREDHGIDDSRHPKKVKLNVKPEEDAKRRDFTINGMFMEISNSKSQISNKFQITNFKWGKVLDCVNGTKDIKNKIIRFIGNPDERIKEDALRMIRGARFSAQLGFDIEKKSFEAIKKNKDLIKKVSAERIKEELNKILISDNPRLGIELLDKLGIFQIIIPEFEKTKTTPQPTNMHLEGSVWNHTLLSLDKMGKAKDPIFAWSVLLHDLAKAYTITTPEKDGTDRIRFSGHDSEGAKMAEIIMRRLKFSNDEINKVSWLVKYHMLFSNLFKMREARKIRYLKHPYFGDLLDLFLVDATSSIRSNKKGEPLPADLRAYDRAKKVYEDEKGKKPLPKPIIRGNDVMKIMGISYGNKKVGEILEKVYDMQLEKRFGTKKEGMGVAKRLLKR